MLSKRVTDTDGYEYELAPSPLSRGGQGAVYSETSGKFVIKLLNRQTPLFEERLRRVQLLLLDGLKVTSIHRMLRPPDIGYVMYQLKGMQPMLELMYPKDRSADFRQWYQDSGGVKRRIQLLKNLSAVFLQLRNRGLIYGDLSPNNVFVSKKQDDHEVYLIDIDNLTYESQAVGKIFTPNYGAPELVRGEACISSRTDIFSFAVLVFGLLCCGHPLKGDLVIDGEPELEQSALRGELPWVYHKSDRRNATRRYLQRETAFAPELYKLLVRTFDYDLGLNDPQKRPTIADWSDAIIQASAQVIVCQNCQWSFFRHNQMKDCPACGSPRPHCFIGRIYFNYTVFNDENQREVNLPEKIRNREIVLQVGQTYVITTSMVGMTNLDGDAPLVELQITSKDRLVVRNLSSDSCWAKSGSDRQTQITDRDTQLSTNAEIHFGLIGRPHRSLRFEYSAG